MSAADELYLFDQTTIRSLAGISDLRVYDPDTLQCLAHREHWPSFVVPRRHPLASVIMCTHNKLGYTFNCLQSLKASCSGYDSRLEVIVVDDASTDRTREFLSEIPGLRVVTLKKNVGFLKSSNLGVDSSSGRYVILLNNDTVVAARWLQAMLETFEKHQHVGAVGSKLIYPSGALQEAGSIIWNDGSGWNYGRFDTAGKSEYQHVRDVDYCSAASLAIDRTLVRPSGIFDERFQPAYYEDTDLCFYVRSRGKRVIYQPQSKVIHFEGISHGREVTGGIKRHQVTNRAKFLEKWTRELRLQYPPDARFLLRARDRSSRRSILVFDHRMLEHDTNSGDNRMFWLLRLLRRSWNVTFVPANHACNEPYCDDVRQEGIEVFCGNDVDGFLRQRTGYYDVVILSRVPVIKAYFDTVRILSPQSLLIVDFPDLESARALSQAKLVGDGSMASEAHVLAEQELDFARKADLAITITDDERKQLLDRDHTLRVQVVPNIHELSSGSLTFEERKNLLFLGGFEHPPNVDSVQFMVRQILPLIRKRLPGVKLLVAGSKMPDTIREMRAPGVEIIGYVKDLHTLFSACKVFVCPIRYGAGLKGKIGTAMAQGLPVVTTSIGAQGFDLTANPPIMVADNPQDFAEHVTSLYTNKRRWRELSSKSKLYARRWSPEVVQQRISDVLARAFPANIVDRFPMSYLGDNAQIIQFLEMQKQLHEIHTSFTFRIMKKITTRIDRIFPDGTTRGEFRLVVVTSLKIISLQGWRSFAKLALEKVRKREFHIVR